MTPARSARRPGSLLAPGGDRLAPPLAALGVLAFIAAVLAVGATAGGRVAATLSDRMQGAATVAVHATGLESADAAAARAVEALAETPGVIQVRALEPAASDGAVASFMQGPVSDAARADTRLLTVSFAPRSTASAATLRSVLRAQDMSASVDDHRLSTSRLWRGAALAGAVLLVTSLVLLLATFGVSRMAARRCLTAQRDVLILLRMSGGTDRFIVRLFRSRIGARAAWAAGAGAAVAVVAIGALRLSGTAPLLAWTDLAAAATWPAVTVLIASGAAALSTRAVLKPGP